MKLFKRKEKDYGYAVSPKRDDYRITCEGVYMQNPPSEYRKDFVNMFYKADECEFNESFVRCWYD